MPLILLSDTSYLNFLIFSVNCLGKSPPNRFRKRISQRAPTNDEEFLLCYGDETPGSVEPSGEHASCFGGGSSECPAQGNLESLAGAR